jgi:uncharacterized protein YlxP (DUF503 family)
MVIGILQFQLLVRGSASLKDKRRVVSSVKDRLHREHLVSVAEVADLESLNSAVLGLACVGNDGAYIASVLDRIMVKLRSGLGYELGDTSREILHGSQLFAAGPAPDPEADPSLRDEILRYAADLDVPGAGPGPEDHP